MMKSALLITLLFAGCTTTQMHQPTIDRVNSYALPELSFRNANFRDIVEYLASNTKPMCPPYPWVEESIESEAVVLFVHIPPMDAPVPSVADQVTRVYEATSSHFMPVVDSMHATNIPVFRAFEHVSDLVGASVSVEKNLIIIRIKKVQQEHRDLQNEPRPTGLDPF
jgi:hypothetical protein